MSHLTSKNEKYPNCLPQTLINYSKGIISSLPLTQKMHREVFNTSDLFYGALYFIFNMILCQRFDAVYAREYVLIIIIIFVK